MTLGSDIMTLRDLSMDEELQLVKMDEEWDTLKTDVTLKVGMTEAAVWGPPLQVKAQVTVGPLLPPTMEQVRVQGQVRSWMSRPKKQVRMPGWVKP